MDNVRILLISSDHGTAEWARNIFTQLPGSPYDLSVCDTYHQGINAMLKSHYQLYMIEHQPGGFNGLQMLHEAIRSNCLEPVIIISPNNDPLTDREALALGASDYVPMNNLCPSLLEKTLRYSLKQARTFSLLKESEQRYRTFFERSVDPIVITDSGGIIEDINPAALRALDTTYEEVIHTNSSRFYADVKDREQLIKALEEKGIATDFEVRVTTARGSSKQFVITAFVQISQHGDKELYHTILRNAIPVRTAKTVQEPACMHNRTVIGKTAYPERHSS